MKNCESQRVKSSGNKQVGAVVGHVGSHVVRGVMQESIQQRHSQDSKQYPIETKSALDREARPAKTGKQEEDDAVAKMRFRNSYCRRYDLNYLLSCLSNGGGGGHGQHHGFQPGDTYSADRPDVLIPRSVLLYFRCSVPSMHLMSPWTPDFGLTKAKWPTPTTD